MLYALLLIVASGAVLVGGIAAIHMGRARDRADRGPGARSRSRCGATGPARLNRRSCARRRLNAVDEVVLSLYSKATFRCSVRAMIGSTAAAPSCAFEVGR
jgi:hypothetical protein